jgi:hypothetical protein
LRRAVALAGVLRRAVPLALFEEVERSDCVALLVYEALSY